MNCHKAKHWLLSAGAADALPAGVRQHLEGCPRCQRLRQQLLQVDGEVRKLPVPPPSPARQRLEQLLDQCPRPQPAAGPWYRPSRRLLARVVAAALVLVVGGLVARKVMLTTRPAPWAATRPVRKMAPPTRKRSEEMALVLRVVHHDVRLSEAAQPDEKLDRLVMLASDLKDEALALLRQGNSDDLPQLAHLYQHVLRHGVARRAANLPAKTRDQVVPGLVKKLWVCDTQLAACVRTAPPLVAAVAQPMRDATRETLDAVKSGRKPAAPAAPLPEVQDTSPLLAALVVNALRLSDESDPLQRAELCAELARRVVPSVVMLSAGGDRPEVGDLVECLAALLSRGVVKNLDEAADQTDRAVRVAEMQRVRARLLEVLAVLDENLAQASPETRAGLQNAMRAAHYVSKGPAGAAPGKKTN